MAPIYTPNGTLEPRIPIGAAPPSPQTILTIVGKHDVHHREHLIWPHLVHKPLFVLCAPLLDLRDLRELTLNFRDSLSRRKERWDTDIWVPDPPLPLLSCSVRVCTPVHTEAVFEDSKSDNQAPMLKKRALRVEPKNRICTTAPSTPAKCKQQLLHLRSTPHQLPLEVPIPGCPFPLATAGASPMRCRHTATVWASGQPGRPLGGKVLISSPPTTQQRLGDRVAALPILLSPTAFRHYFIIENQGIHRRLADCFLCCLVFASLWKAEQVRSGVSSHSAVESRGGGGC